MNLHLHNEYQISHLTTSPIQRETITSTSRRCKNNCYECFLFILKVSFICLIWILFAGYFIVYFVYMLQTYAVSHNCHEEFIWWTLMISSVYICFQLSLFGYLCMENFDNLCLCALCSRHRFYKRKCIQDFDMTDKRLTCFLLTLNVVLTIFIIINLNLFIYTCESYYQYKRPMIIMNIGNSILHFFFTGIFILFTTENYNGIHNMDIEDIYEYDSNRYIHDDNKHIEYEYI